MLQPKEQKTEDSEFGRLIYDCRICGYFEKAKAGDEADHCVYRSSEQTQTGTNQAAGGGESGPKFFFQVDKECVKDPTLSRRKDLICRKCGHNEAVTFMNPTKDRMNLIFVCTKCTFYWRKEKAEGDPVYSDDEEDDNEEDEDEEDFEYAAAAAERKSQVRTVDRSERIRTYNFPENRLSDHRVNYKSNNLDAVLNGELDDVIQALLDADKAAKLSATS
jgi:DNA-directed RNA polymerase subunit M/transcription elongation factor TFIIS